jgi:hypothetical protein
VVSVRDADSILEEDALSLERDVEEVDADMNVPDTLTDDLRERVGKEGIILAWDCEI